MTANLTELWEHFIANTEDAVDQDWQPRFVWISHAVVKITPKRIWTEPYHERRDFPCDGYTHREVNPQFDRQKLERDGFAWHRSAGGRNLQLFVSRDVELEDMGDEGQRIVEAGNHIAGTFPQGMTRDELSEWMRIQFDEH